MSDFFDNINKNEIGKLIHVGAGTGIDLKDYVTQCFTEILLLEPIPKVFKQLEHKVFKLNDVNVDCNMSVLNVALSGTADTDKVFYITLPNRYSSLHKADRLKTLFQNLKTEQEITVNTINFSDLIKKSSLDKDKKNALVLQINGAEFDVLAEAETSELMMFSNIIIQQSNNNYFENTKPSIDLISLMESKGFQLALEVDNDVVFSSLIFRKDEKTLKLKYLTEENKIQAARIGELENQLKASNEAKTSETNKANDSVEQSKTQVAYISELEKQLKASNEAKVNAVNKGVKQSKIQTERVTELEKQLNASNEAKVNAVNKGVKQSKIQTERVTELEKQLKSSNEAKVNAVNKGVKQSKIQTERVTELESQLKTSNEANAVNKCVEQNKSQTARVTELESQLKISNKTKASEVFKSAEKNKAQALIITKLETQNSNLGSKISSLESEKQDLIYRQTILDKEIVKVEAQLELIKDVVLRDKAF